jgi:RHS repeat-associated protein
MGIIAARRYILLLLITILFFGFLTNAYSQEYVYQVSNEATAVADCQSTISQANVEYATQYNCLAYIQYPGTDAGVCQETAEYYMPPSLDTPPDDWVYWITWTWSCTGAGTASNLSLGCACANAPTFGDSINPATGNKFLDEDDYVGGWLSFSRYYNSSSNVVSTEIGQQWRHSFDRSLDLETVNGAPPGIIIALRDDGVQELFTKSNGSWIPDIGLVADTLTEQDNSQGTATSYTLFVASTHQYETYSAAGVLQTVQDETGQGVSLTYSTSSTPTSVAPTAGLLISVIDAKGRQLNLTYTATGQVQVVTQPDGGTLTYGYNSTGNLTSVTFPDSSDRQYTYNDPNYVDNTSFPNGLTEVIDETGANYDYTFYHLQSAIETFQGTPDLGANSYNWNYNYSGLQFPLGVAVPIYFTSSANGPPLVSELNISSCEPQCNGPQSITYDANLRPQTSTDFNGNVTATTYSNQGLLTQKVEAQGQSAQRTTNTTWDTKLLNPLQTTVTNAGGTIVSNTSWVYNSLGEAIAKCEIDPTNSAASGYTCSSAGTVPSGVRRWTFTYCTAVGASCPLPGLLLSATGPRTDLAQTMTYSYYTSASAMNCGTPGSACHQSGDLYQVTDALGHVTTYVSYDADGRVTRSTDPNGVNTDITYYPRGWIKTKTIGGSETSYSYTPYGNLQTVTDPDGVTTSYKYDAAHRLVQVNDDLGNYTQYWLNAAGDVTSEAINDSSNNYHFALSRIYNNQGELVEAYDGYNNRVFDSYGTGGYDNNGNLILSVDAYEYETQHVYDALNRETQTVNNYEGSDTATQNTTTSFQFDSLNHLTQVTDPSSLNTSYTYDGLNDQTVRASPDAGSTSRTYDTAGDILTSTDAKGVVTTNTYDALNRLLSTSYADTTQNVTYSYDDPNSTTSCGSSYPIGRLTRIIENAVTTVYCYDAQGSVTKKRQITSAGTDSTSYSYTSAERLSGIIYPSGTAVSYVRDGDGRIQSISVTPPGGSTSTAVSGVTYMPFGPVSGYTFGNGQVVSRAYDYNYRLTAITSPAFSLYFARDLMGDITAIGNSPGASPASEIYTFDPLYRITTITEADGNVLESVTYNQSGDRLTKSGSGISTGTYSYNPNTHQLLATGNAARTVDADGNTTAISQAGSTYGFGYSARNRMTVAQLGGTTVANYTYSALNERIQKTTGTTTERYDYNQASNILSEYGQTNRDYIWMDGIPVANVDLSGASSTIAYVTADQLGTPRAITNNAAAIEWLNPYQSNPWNELTPTSNSGYVYNLRFPGQYFDAETGLSNNVNRDFDSSVGRYLQSDPTGLRAGINTYAYVRNNPLLLTDALGLCDDEVARCKQVKEDAIDECTEDMLPTRDRTDQAWVYQNCVADYIETHGCGPGGTPLPKPDPSADPSTPKVQPAAEDALLLALLAAIARVMLTN